MLTRASANHSVRDWTVNQDFSGSNLISVMNLLGGTRQSTLTPAAPAATGIIILNLQGCCKGNIKIKV